MKRSGLAQIPLMIGLLLMAIAVPVATKLVQTNQENRGRAALDDGGGGSATPTTVGTSTKQCLDYKKCGSAGGCITYKGPLIPKTSTCPTSTCTTDPQCPKPTAKPTSVKPTYPIPTITTKPIPTVGGLTPKSPTLTPKPTGAANCNSLVGRPIGCSCILNTACLPNNCVSGECAADKCDVAVGRPLGCPCDLNLQCVGSGGSCIGGHCSVAGSCSWLGNTMTNNTTQCFTSTLGGPVLSQVVSCKEGKTTVIQSCPGLQTKCDSNTKCSTVSLMDSVENLTASIKALNCNSGVDAFKTSCSAICKSYPNAIMLVNGGCTGICNLYAGPACVDNALRAAIKSAYTNYCRNNPTVTDKAKICAGVCSPSFLAGIFGTPTFAACTAACTADSSLACAIPTITQSLKEYVDGALAKACNGSTLPNKATVCAAVCAPNLLLGIMGAPTATVCTAACVGEYSLICKLAPTATPTVINGATKTPTKIPTIKPSITPVTLPTAVPGYKNCTVKSCGSDIKCNSSIVKVLTTQNCPFSACPSDAYCASLVPTTVPGGALPTKAPACDPTKYQGDKSGDIWLHFDDAYTAGCICGETDYQYNCAYKFWACGDGSKSTNCPSCIAECPDRNDKTILNSCTPSDSDGTTLAIKCSGVGLKASCGGKTYCCPSAGADWTTDLSKCDGGGTCTQCVGKPDAKVKGDADCSGATNINDASIWRSEFIEGELGTVAKNSWNADFDCNGKVNLNDISIWRDNFIKGL